MGVRDRREESSKNERNETRDMGGDQNHESLMYVERFRLQHKEYVGAWHGESA